MGSVFPFYGGAARERCFEMITSSVILDIVIVAIVIINIFIGKKRGLFRTLAELLSYIVGWIVTSALAEKVSVVAAKRIETGV